MNENNVCGEVFVRWSCHSHLNLSFQLRGMLNQIVDNIHGNVLARIVREIREQWSEVVQAEDGQNVLVVVDRDLEKTKKLPGYCSPNPEEFTSKE